MGVCVPIARNFLLSYHTKKKEDLSGVFVQASTGRRGERGIMIRIR